MIYHRVKGCGGCYKPNQRRLASMQDDNVYECYGESYVKCFWGLCDHQRTIEAFAVKSDGAVVTDQPRRTAFHTLAENN